MGTGHGDNAEPSLTRIAFESLLPRFTGGFSERRTMLADQFLEAADGSRTGAALDELARKLWRAHAEGQIADANAEALSEALQARRAALAGEVAHRPPKAASGPPRACATNSAAEKRIEFRVGIHVGDCDLMGDGVNIAARRHREKVFGVGCPRALDRNAKVRIMHWARCFAQGGMRDALSTLTMICS
jgi:hypothetical protein